MSDDKKPRLETPCPGLYKICRVSYRPFDEGPCEGAFEADVLHVDRRSVDSPSKLNLERDRATWNQEGVSHRVENGEICRDLGTRREWFVLITDLMEFSDKEGELIIGRDRDGFGYVKIYDDLIE